MIHLCLPNAVILHSVRDPVDTCLGCYKQIFVSGHETTYDLTLVGKTYVLYRRLMEHWNRVLPGRVVDVVYEKLVADPETEIRRLLAACGLPWDDACLRFHENQRTVKTRPARTRSASRSTRARCSAGGATRSIWGRCWKPSVPMRQSKIGSAGSS